MCMLRKKYELNNDVHATHMKTNSYRNEFRSTFVLILVCKFSFFLRIICAASITGAGCFRYCLTFIQASQQQLEHNNKPSNLRYSNTLTWNVDAHFHSSLICNINGLYLYLDMTLPSLGILYSGCIM